MDDCPYSENNLDIETSDRYESDNESVESDEDPEDFEDEDDEEDEAGEGEDFNAKEEKEDEVNEQDEGAKEQIEIQMTSDMSNLSSNDDDEAFANYSFSLMEQEYSMPSNIKQLLNGGEVEFQRSEVSSWDYTHVERFVHILTGCSQSARMFAAEVRIYYSCTRMLEKCKLLYFSFIFV